MKATYGMLSQVTYPLAEAGYYVLPVALVDETFRQNGLTTPADIHQLPTTKLREIFGADAGLYVTVTQYGTKYMLLSSASIVTASAKLIDLKSGTTLWTGTATASSEEGNSNSGGLVGALISAAVNQIIASAQDDASYPIAGMTGARLLSAGQPGGLLYGPRSPKYGTD
ncbi:MAG: putative lipoprotein [Stenotrophomonas maltophilia]|nr:MAG: putative lipoprotein [Stenotrophomonas maltophilia]